MKILTAKQIPLVSAGAPHRQCQVIVQADVSAECASFVASTWEQVFNKLISVAEGAKLIFVSPFDTVELEKAFAGMKYRCLNG